MLNILWLVVVGGAFAAVVLQFCVAYWDKRRKRVLEIATEFVDRMEGHREELRWDDTTFRLLFELIKALRDAGFDAAPWWRN